MNPVGWFEVPVGDMARAIHFYNSVFDWELKETPMGPLKMAWFPWTEGGQGAAGSLVEFEAFYKPSDTQGVLVYFRCADVAETLEKVRRAGGKVLQEKKQITEDVGYMGLFIDSEGNRIALHSNA